MRKIFSGVVIKVSVVTTLFNSEIFVHDFYAQTMVALKQIQAEDYEIIIVDDGSSDNSLAKAIGLANTDPNITVIELSRNFGHHSAIMTGLRSASGDLVFFVDSDLEEKPRLLVKFHKLFVENNVDVVFGVQEKRTGSWFNDWTGRAFYRLFNFLSDTPIPKNMLNVRLMSADYVASLLLYNEKSVFMAGLWATVGYHQLATVVERDDRATTSYGFTKRLSLMVTGLSAFSKKPLVLVFYLGAIMSASAFIFILYLFFQYFQGIDVPGYMSTIASTWLFGGIMLLCQGVIAIYLSKIFEEVKNRPVSIVKKKHKVNSSK